MVQSRTRWYELGEKNSKYIFNITKRNHNKNYTSKLKSSPTTTITETQEILAETIKFYSKLYSSASSNPHNPTFFDFQNFPKLTSEQQEWCEGLLTENEVWIAISFQNNKTPGTDGLTAEFLTVFWSDINKPLVELPK